MEIYSRTWTPLPRWRIECSPYLPCSFLMSPASKINMLVLTGIQLGPHWNTTWSSLEYKYFHRIWQTLSIWGVLSGMG